MTKRQIDENLIYEILSAAEEIPAGQVATYGQIAELLGRERNARLVEKSSPWRNCTGIILVTVL